MPNAFKFALYQRKLLGEALLKQCRVVHGAHHNSGDTLSQQRLFLQNHLMACASCRQSLATCRDLYYSVDAMIPQPSPGSDSELTLRELQRAWEETRKWMQPIRRTFIGGLGVFIRRRDVQVALAALAALVIAWATA